MGKPNGRLRIEIDGPSLRSLIVADVIRSLTPGGHAAMDDRTLDALRALPVAQLASASSLAEKTVYVELNLRRLLEALRRCRQLPESDPSLAYFLENGASYTLIGRLFQLGRREVMRLMAAGTRSSVHAGGLGRRQTLPSPTERDAIHAAWVTLDGTPVERYIALHGRFPAWPLSALDAVLNEFRE